MEFFRNITQFLSVYLCEQSLLKASEPYFDLTVSDDKKRNT